ncbi:hypothetical protein EV426DRAFT_600935 [Tirmania nivea]|nr:hypothetical protein EV426DRAFT_600935 [Tirmania nivea]
MNIEPKEIPLTDLKELHNYLSKRLYLICAILIFVSDLCGTDIKILVEESMPGKIIHVDGQFEFIIEWKGKC